MKTLAQKAQLRAATTNDPRWADVARDDEEAQP